MNQQVNLYHPMFRRERPVFAARSMARGLVVAIVGLGAIYIYPALQVEVLERETRGLATQRESAIERITRLEETLPAREPSLLLAAEVERLTGEVGRREELLDAFTSQVNREDDGFSDHLAGLARQRVDGLWLTALAIEDGGARLDIGGSAVRPELVPVLVQRLAREEVFEGASFGHLTLEREDAAGTYIDFRLRTATAAE